MSGLSTGSLDESSLLSMIRDLEATVAKIDKEMEDLTKGSLTKHLQAKSQGYLTKIHQIEADVSKSLFPNQSGRGRIIYSRLETDIFLFILTLLSQNHNLRMIHCLGV